MSLTNTTRSVTHTGNDATTVWPYAFQILENAAAYVELTEISTGIVTTLDSSLYTITGIGGVNGGLAIVQRL